MTATFNRRDNIWLLTPLFGILIYVSLYVTSTFFYPGGNQVDKSFKGFSWAQNYWCNLLNENAIDGRYNPARPIALIAMFVLCFSLIFFWYVFPIQVGFKKSGRVAIQLSAFIAMALGIFLFTSYHDIIINVATLCGLVAIAGTFIGLQKQKQKKLFWLGIFNILLMVINNVLYYNKGLLFYLPIVQKITFLFFLLWICLININLYKKRI